MHLVRCKKTQCRHTTDNMGETTQQPSAKLVKADLQADMFKVVGLVRECYSKLEKHPLLHAS